MVDTGMSEKKLNLREEIEAQLPPELVHFIKIAGEAANAQGQNIYLVGGVVRDLLLKKTTLDLDLVVEGDALALARSLAEGKPVKLTTHSRFNTAKLAWQGWSVDIATSRSESYARPGALPDVKPDSIRNDLYRRDFTVNAMAVYLSPDRYGDLLDIYGGVNDLNNRLIRVLHGNSFIDDATRVWRAIRYEQRLGFKIEESTMALLKKNISMLDTISGDRIRNELVLVLKEEHPEKALTRVAEMGVLAKVHPALQMDEWLEEGLREAQIYNPGKPVPPALSFALLTCRLGTKAIEELVSYLRIPRAIADVMRDTVSIIIEEQLLAQPGIAPSRIYDQLHGYSPQAIMAVSIATDSETAQAHIRLYLDKLRYIKTSMNGHDLIRLGIPEGPRVKEVLRKLLYARLDGKVTSREGEEEMIKGLQR
jgi:tRNA nucleotidyltransferase (CCA-adding enzyme)